MSNVLFIFIDRKGSREQMKMYSVPIKQYVAIVQHPYLEEGQSIPISGHAVAFDGEDLRGIFRITVAYPESGRAFLPEWGELGELFDGIWYRAYIVHEPRLEKEIPLELLPVKCVMYPHMVQIMLSETH